MKLTTAHIRLLAIAILLPAVFAFLRNCNPVGVRQSAVTRVERDTVFIRIPPPPPVIDTLRGERRIVYKHGKPDSVMVHAVERMIHERDSLAHLLATRVELSYTADTVIQTTRDTLRIECDELAPRIPFALHYGEQIIPVENTTIYTQDPNPFHRGPGIGLFLGGGIGADGIARITIGAGLIYGFIYE